jgi:hypothetical protein
MLVDAPRNGNVPGYPGTWKGFDYVTSRFNDRIKLIHSVGMTIAMPDPIPVHYNAASLTDIGRRAGEALVADIPKQQSTRTIGGVRLSIGGTKLKVHGA